jgi:prenyltransferase beta subunit
MNLVLRVNDFVRAMSTGRPGEYTMCPGGSATLYSSCFAAMTLHYTGRLDTLSTSECRQWAQYLAGFQDPESGYFIGPELVPEELTSEVHDYEHVAMHLAAHVLPALSLLDAAPRHTLAFAHRFLNPNELTSWLEARNWRRAWLEGNNLLFIGQFLLHLRDREHRPEAAKSLGIYFDWLDSQIDPQTGLWGTNGFCSPFVAMCGGYHQLLVYYAEGRDVLYKERLVDTVLSLQHPDGGFSPNGGGGACEDVDAADILVNMYKLCDHRRQDIRAALKRLLDSLAPNHMADGGYLYRRDQAFSHMGILKTQSPANVSNLFATWFRVHSVALISEILADETVAQTAWRFNDVCSMGWHRSWRTVPGSGGRKGLFRKLFGHCRDRFSSSG